MSNRRKQKDNKLRIKKPRFRDRGLAKKEYVAIEDLQPGYIDPNGVELLKVVPAKANGIDVGRAYIWDDGSISYKEDPNADPEALALVHQTEQEVGYSLSEGRPFAVGEPGGPDGPPKED